MTLHCCVNCFKHYFAITILWPIEKQYQHMKLGEGSTPLYKIIYMNEYYMDNEQQFTTIIYIANINYKYYMDGRNFLIIKQFI